MIVEGEPPTAAPAAPGRWRLRLGETPFGPLVLTFSLKGLVSLEFPGEETPAPLAPAGAGAAVDPDPPPPAVLAYLGEASSRLAECFSGAQADFSSIPLDIAGTPFQLRVWQELTAIPWGSAISYGELARRLGRPGAARAVGQAVGANPIPIIIPCHRVIAANGSLGGYRGGPERKRRLLAHEGR